MGQGYGRIVPGNSARLAGEPAAGGASAFGVASCPSNQFDVPGKRCARTMGQAGVAQFSSSGEIRASAPDSGLGKPSVGVRHRTP
jgi:hypothetical protein